MCIIKHCRNGVVQMEMKLDASQETIVDQQQTIEKFRELVRGMQGEMGELRAKGERKTSDDTAPQAQAMMSLQTQLKSSAMKQTSRVSWVLHCEKKNEGKFMSRQLAAGILHALKLLQRRAHLHTV